MGIGGFQNDDLHSIASLSGTAKYQETLKNVDEEVAKHGDNLPASWAGPSEADPVYKLIVACNELVMSIDEDISKTHNYIKQKYGPAAQSYHTRQQ
jgi:hypothetical protein